jgi:predicted amidophosphoribosyltransferase
MADIAGLLEKADSNHFAAVHLLRRKCRPERFGGKKHEDTVDLFELRKVEKADTLSRLGWKAILVDDIVVTGTSCVQARTLVAAQLHELPECVCLAGN